MILKQTSYYSLISGYKDIFKNPTTKKYKDGTRFEDIVELYYFDELLRQLFLRYLIKVYPLSDGMSAEEIEEMISYYVQAKIIENDLNAQVENVIISGSRCRGIAIDINPITETGLLAEYLESAEQYLKEKAQERKPERPSVRKKIKQTKQVSRGKKKVNMESRKILKDSIRIVDGGWYMRVYQVLSCVYMT